MKYLLVLAVVLVAFYLWRGNRRDSMRAPPPPAPPRPLAAPETMARCAQCGMHLPETDAVTGRRGSYCSPAHRDQAEG